MRKEMYVYKYCMFIIRKTEMYVPDGSHDTITSNVCLSRFSNAVRTLS